MSTNIRPLHRFDVSQEEELGGRQHLLHTGGEPIPIASPLGSASCPATRRDSRNHDDCLVVPAILQGVTGFRFHITDDGEVFRAGVDLRSVGNRIHGLEPESETADGVEIALGALRAAGDSADAPYVRVVERISEVPKLQFVVVQPEPDRPHLRCRLLDAAGQRVLGVLEQLQQEVGRVGVLVGEDDVAPLLGGIEEFVLHLPPDRIVVTRSA